MQPHHPQQQQYPHPPQMYGPPMVVVQQQPPTSGTAVASLVLGILGALGGWCVFGLPSILAVVCGHAGLHDIKRTARSGRGMAIAGLVLGYIFAVPWIVLGVMMLLGAVSSPFLPDPSPTSGP